MGLKTWSKLKEARVPRLARGQAAFRTLIGTPHRTDSAILTKMCNASGMLAERCNALGACATIGPSGRAATGMLTNK